MSLSSPWKHTNFIVTLRWSYINISKSNRRKSGINTEYRGYEQANQSRYQDYAGGDNIPGPRVLRRLKPFDVCPSEGPMGFRVTPTLGPATASEESFSLFFPPLAPLPLRLPLSLSESSPNIRCLAVSYRASRSARVSVGVCDAELLLEVVDADGLFSIRICGWNITDGGRGADVGVALEEEITSSGIGALAFL